jgi:cyclic-di-GMP phosphodiesterase TipF (flagellum assembly factor)
MIKRLANEVSLNGDGPRGSEPQDNAMRASIDALFATADTMRAAATKIAPINARRDRDSLLPPPIAPTHARLSTIAEAVAVGRMDVLLEPIVGVGDNHVHHYEVTVHPRDERGHPVPVAGHDRQLARTGLQPLLDSARLVRASQVLRSFAEQGQKHCVFVAASGEALATDRFLDDLAHMYREREALAGELVLSFSQNDIRGFGGIEWSALTDMRDLNFRFCLRDVTDLDYEFTALRSSGFAFVNLEAESLINGLPGPGGITQAGEICRHLSDIGLTVVAGGVDDDAVRAAIIRCGARLAQGAAFGPSLTIAGKGYPGPGIVAA